MGSCFLIHILIVLERFKKSLLNLVVSVGTYISDIWIITWEWAKIKYLNVLVGNNENTNIIGTYFSIVGQALPNALLALLHVTLCMPIHWKLHPANWNATRSSKCQGQTNFKGL